MENAILKKTCDPCNMKAYKFYPLRFLSRNVLNFLKHSLYTCLLLPNKTSNKLDKISQARSLAEVQTLPVAGVSIQHVSPFDHIQSVPHPQAPKQNTSQLGWGTFVLSLYKVYFK